MKFNIKTKKNSKVSLEKEKILCNHCKRTASNGIREVFNVAEMTIRKNINKKISV